MVYLVFRFLRFLYKEDFIMCMFHPSVISNGRNRMFESHGDVSLLKEAYKKKKKAKKKRLKTQTKLEFGLGWD